MNLHIKQYSYLKFVICFTQLDFKVWKFYTWKCVNLQQNSVNYHVWKLWYMHIELLVKLHIVCGWNTTPCARLQTQKITLKALSFMYPLGNFTLDSKLFHDQRLWWLWQIWGVAVLYHIVVHLSRKHLTIYQFMHNGTHTLHAWLSTCVTLRLKRAFYCSKFVVLDLRSKSLRGNVICSLKATRYTLPMPAWIKIVRHHQLELNEMEIVEKLRNWRNQVF